MHELNLTIDEYEQRRVNLIRQHFNAYEFDDYIRFVRDCAQLITETDQQHRSFQLHNGINIVLSAMAERNPKLYREVLSHYLDNDDPLNLDPRLPVRVLLSTTGAVSGFRLLNERSYHTKRKWLFGFYQSLREEEITLQHAEELWHLYKTSAVEDIPYHSDYLLNFRKAASDFVERVIDIILERAKETPQIAHLLSITFNPHSETGKQLGGLFSANLELLKRAYFAYTEAEGHSDYDGSVFNRILDRDAKFTIEYVDWMYLENNRPHRCDDRREYSFLWMRTDYFEVIMQTVEHVCTKQKAIGSAWSGYLEAFFALEEHIKPIQERVNKEDELLIALIRKHHSDSFFMKLIFGVISQMKGERKKKFFAVFLENNKDYHSFEELPLHPWHEGWSGSIVPIHQAKINFFTSLLPLVNTVELLQHKQYIEQIIDRYQKAIEQAKKHEFMND